MAITTCLAEKAEFLSSENDGDYLSEEDGDPHKELTLSDFIDPENIYIHESVYSKFLIMAVRMNEDEIVKDLLDNSCFNLNEVDKFGMTLLHYAVDFDTFEILKILVKRGALLDFGNTWENTPLHFVVKNSSRDYIRHLLDSGASVNFKSYQSNTPLHYAIATKDLEIIDMLVSNSADINAVSKSGSPLCISCGFYSNSELIKFIKREDNYSYVCDKRVIDDLLEHGAQMNLRTEKRDSIAFSL
ncbi:serine/threonine-protein phosphatase 6 regulatory ankyrin repeat subunit A-like [Belonocnema kinseyi]|uniref:serine/threonine-protein phosphatase 6 regulatory ankyrin repeat subunit A-like n=1 Tax=Belonocnema kinseyi TaxID=2817044 RepID=UPI00143D519C|nr:serine/threonine-protein phosphatase 6 regulatory ankyrin repeat subunit A-like [Belonocnema kinseyi]